MGRIFISYRRDDAAADANALYQTLAQEFGEDLLFKDVDDLPLGANWKVAIEKAVAASSVILVVLGPAWVPSQAIEIEVDTALRNGVPVIPILVRGARIDEVTSGLDGPMAQLADLNGAELDHASWNRDLIPVIESLRDLLDTVALGDEDLQAPETSGGPASSRSSESVGSEPPSERRWQALVRERVGRGITEKITFDIRLSNSDHVIILRWNTWDGGALSIDGEDIELQSTKREAGGESMVVDGSIERLIRVRFEPGARKFRWIDVAADGRLLFSDRT